MIINPSSISFESILTDVIDYIQSKPNYASWKDFYADGAGETITELIAGLSAYLSYTVTANRRETYLFYCQALSSAIAGAENLGYTTFRGRNPIVSAILTLNQALMGTVESGVVPKLYIPKYTVVGTYQEYDLIAYDPADEIISLSYPTDTLQMLIGSIEQQTLIIPSNDTQVFRFDVQISADFQLYLKKKGESDYTLLPCLSSLTSITDFMDSKVYWVKTNALGGIDVLYMNGNMTSNPVDPNFQKYLYDAGDTLMVSYVQLQNTTFELEQMPLSFSYNNDIIGTTTTGNISLLSGYQQPETLAQIQMNAPINHEVGRVVRGRDDYKKLLSSVILEQTGYVCADTSSIDISPSVIGLSYVLEGTPTYLTQEQQSLVLQVLENYRMYGCQPPVLSYPACASYPISLNITVYLETAYITYSKSLIQNDINTILSSYQRTLGAILNSDFLQQIEHNINQLDYVKISRVSILGLDVSLTQTVLPYNYYVSIDNFYLTIG